MDDIFGATQKFQDSSDMYIMYFGPLYWEVQPACV